MAFGFLTFVAAVLAARYAKRAAVATEETVNTAIRLGNTQLRAWVFFDDNSMSVETRDSDGLIGAIGFRFIAKNCGSTPALEAFMRVGAEVNAIPTVNFRKSLPGAGVAVGPGENVGSEIVYFSPELIMSIRPKGDVVYMKCGIWYQDIFSQETRCTIKTVRIHFTGTMDVRACKPEIVGTEHFDITASGENIMT